MTSINEERRDGKLLLAVVGLVVAGAAGIALLAGLTAQREAEEQRRAEAAPAVERRAPAAERPVPTPASFVRPATGIEPGPPPVIDEQASAKEIVVDLDADLVAVAVAAWEAREFPKAVAYFQAEADRRPGSAWVEYMLGLSLWKDGRADEAVSAMQRSIEIDPAFVRTFINLSRIQNDRGEFDAALQAADDALELESDDPEALFLRARSLRNLDRIDDALVALETSLDLDPGNGFAHNLLGLIRIEQGHAEQAAQALERAAACEPNVAYIQNNLGMARELSGRRDEALVAYRRAVELDADHTRARLNLARLGPPAPVTPEDDRQAEDLADAVATLGDADSSAVETGPLAPR